jgi:hypothetical protein
VPLVQYLPSTITKWALYCGFICLLFGVIKLLNYRLHSMFDTGECVVEEAGEEESSRDVQLRNIK